MLEDQRLDKAVHDRNGFDCGVPELNNYLKRLAAQHRRKSISNTYVLVDPEKPSKILGYYTLSSAEADVDQLAESDGKSLPNFPVPCIRMGRLACSIEHQGKGIGRLLIGCAVNRCLIYNQEIAAFALLVDAKDLAAKSFYEHYGFTAFKDKPQTLYLPLGR